MRTARQIVKEAGAIFAEAMEEKEEELFNRAMEKEISWNEAHRLLNRYVDALDSFAILRRIGKEKIRVLAALKKAEKIEIKYENRLLAQMAHETVEAETQDPEGSR